jgi:AraC-like DNA-binding protein
MTPPNISRFTLGDIRDAVPCIVHRHVIQFTAVKEHTHDHTEVVLILSGEGTHEQMGVRHPVRAGDVMVVNEGCSHAIPEVRGLEVSNVKFNLGAFLAHGQELANLPGYRMLFDFKENPPLGLEARPQAYMRLPDERFAEIRRLAYAIEDEVFKERVARDTVLRCLIPQFIAELCRRAPVSQGAAPPVRRPLGHIIGYLEANFAYGEISLPVLARRAGLSVNQFLRVFQKSYGCSPMQYVLRRRLAHACGLLADPRLQITQVAYESGFQDSNYFSRQFRASYGATPRVYRQRLLAARPREIAGLAPRH